MTAIHNPVLFSLASNHGAYADFHQSLPSQIHEISPLVDRIMSFIAALREVDGSELDIEVALREALANAIVHGNREDSCKRVSVRCRCSADGEVSITIQDEGQGFEGDTVPDPTIPENRVRTSGRGIYLIKTLMDEVRFEQRGTVVHMRKRLKVRSGVEGETR
jgi:serine/threonine-protein kinase RsbW